jgi:hypothetical protein
MRGTERKKMTGDAFSISEKAMQRYTEAGFRDVSTASLCEPPLLQLVGLNIPMHAGHPDCS